MNETERGFRVATLEYQYGEPGLGTVGHAVSTVEILTQYLGKPVESVGCGGGLYWMLELGRTTLCRFSYDPMPYSPWQDKPLEMIPEDMMLVWNISANKLKALRQLRAIVDPRLVHIVALTEFDPYGEIEAPDRGEPKGGA